MTRLTKAEAEDLRRMVAQIGTTSVAFGRRDISDRLKAMRDAEAAFAAKLAALTEGQS